MEAGQGVGERRKRASASVSAAIMANPAERRRRSQAAKARWADPQTRARMVAGMRGRRPAVQALWEEKRRERNDIRRAERLDRLNQALADAGPDCDLRTAQRTLAGLRSLVDPDTYARLEGRYLLHKAKVERQRAERAAAIRQQKEAQWGSTDG